MEAKIRIDEELYFSAISAEDKPLYVKYLNDRVIYDQTLRIPFPYTEADAELFINAVALDQQVKGMQTRWALRKVDGELIGGIGRHSKYAESPHRDEIGYWLAAPFRGKGIMTKAVKTFCDFLVNEHGLTRIEAPVFDFNVASCRVVEKCGFVFEGIMKKAYIKNGKYIDGKMYALVK